MQLEDLLLSKILDLNPDLATSAKPAGNRERTGQQNWEPDPLGRQYSILLFQSPKTSVYLFLVCIGNQSSTGLSGSITHLGLTAEQLRRNSWRKAKKTGSGRAQLTLHRWINESTKIGLDNPY